jgi:hypothetical protein
MLLKGSDHAVYIQNADGRYVYFSMMPGDRVPWGIVGCSPFEFFEPGTVLKIVGRVKEVAARGIEFSEEIAFKVGGEVFRFFGRLTPLHDPMGGIRAVMTVSVKIAEFRHLVGRGQTPVPRPKGGPDPMSLTVKEREILRLIARGLTSNQIAAGLSIIVSALNKLT